MAKRLANTFCRCIKSVRKTLKARKGSTKEQGAIAVCVKSVLQTRGKTLRKFRCGPKQSLKTRKYLGGRPPFENPEERPIVSRPGIFGWASVNGTLGEMIAATERNPARREANVQEWMKRVRSHDVPAVTPDKEHYYQEALRKAEPYPEIKDFIESIRQGSRRHESDWDRREPLIRLREGLKKSDPQHWR